MNRTELLEKVAAIAQDQLAIDPAIVAEDASFTTTLGVDSLDLLQLVTAIEDELNIVIPDEAFEHMATVGQALDVIEGLL